jgi:glycine/D-amino acid oxidase-like deaminating enzyme
VAAGLYNPIVFKRTVKSWMVDELLPEMDAYYPRMETLLNQQFYFKKNILKVFVDKTERDQWFAKAALPEYKKYLSTEPVSLQEEIVSYKEGAAEVLDAGHLDSLAFISAWREFILKKNLLLNEPFNYSILQPSNNKVNYKDFEFEQVVFCEGYQAINNPFFNYLPFNLTKGDLLKVVIPGLSSEYVINKSVFVLPQKDQSFKVGSTYQWKFVDDNPEKLQSYEIEAKLKQLIKTPFSILDHTAGIRPTVKDRRPFLGRHPQFKEFIIFNGLGTKGVMLAPYFAKHLLSYLLDGKSLNKEVDIARFQV